MEALRAEALALFRAPNVSLHQKLDALAELAVPAPTVQGSLAVLIGSGLIVTQPSGWVLIMALLLLGPSRIGVLAALAIVRRKQVTQDLLAFGSLPFYSAWRMVVAMKSILPRSSKRSWIRTERN